MVDLKLTADGDLALDSQGDLATVTDYTEITQQAALRLRSADADLVINAAFAANLFELRGAPNTRETGEEGARRIQAALTAGGLVNPGDLYIRPVPVSRYEIAWFVFIRRDGETADGFQITLDLDRGIIVEGVRS